MISADDLEPLMPPPPALPELACRWAMVTATVPLRIRFDGDADPQPGTPVTLTPGLGVGVRVLCMLLGRQIVVIGSPAGSTPPGTLHTYAGATPPPGWLLAHGQTVARAAYPALYAAIGTTYGAGDGATTFRLPDGRGRVLAGRDPAQPEFATLGQSGGATSHTLTENEMPTHSHGMNGGWGIGGLGTGVFRADDNDPATYWSNTKDTGGSQPHNNLQPYLTISHIIKT